MIVSAHEGYPRWINSGADYIEIDIRRSAEGAFIVSHDEPRPGAKLVTLTEVLDKSRGRVGIQLDLKGEGWELDLIEETGVDRVVITTPSHASIDTIKSKYPNLKCGLTRQFAEQTDADFLALDQRHVTEDSLELCDRYAIPVWVWTVDDKRLMRRLINDWRVHGIITNLPDLALKLRRARS
ncbi:MAG TPA: glycerophosphodiester phosphodiesterase [Candidatus Dormibacteraeota bacterium]|nr:glycerophosphodiester phosphodiesterase [Candidatus Dormibacteraeota bacterium]